MIRKKARGVGINHVSLEVNNINDALEFYGKLFDFRIGVQTEAEASLELGDQFIALTKGRAQERDLNRHFGLVVDDKEIFRQTLIDEGVEILKGRFLGFIDPWGNHIEIIGYENIQFTKIPSILNGMGLSDLRKSDRAKKELKENGYL